MAVYLPPTLGALAKVAERLTTRYATNCIRVLDPANGTYRCEVTDGKRLLIARGHLEEASYPAADAFPGGGTELLVPAADWAQVFRPTGKKPVGLAMSPEGHGVLVAWNGTAVPVPKVDQRFPPIDSVLPTRAAVIQVAVQPALLASLLQALAGLGAERVDLLYFARGKPLGLIAHTDSGLYLDGLIMPLD